MTQIFAHRGASGYAPENTLEAFNMAAQMGAEGVELDVHLTLDGEIVVAHDESIDRVSDGSGRIAKMTLEDLRKYHFNRAFPEFLHATIPTLKEVFELLKNTRMTINIELKNSIVYYEQLEEKCLSLVREMGMEKRVLFSSFNHYSIARMVQLAPDIPCGLLYDATLYRPWEYASRLKVAAIHPHFSELQVEGEVEEAHRNNLMVNVWTVNSMTDIRKCLKLKPDIMITNYPDRALEIRHSLHI